MLRLPAPSCDSNKSTRNEAKDQDQARAAMRYHHLDLIYTDLYYFYNIFYRYKL